MSDKKSQKPQQPQEKSGNAPEIPEFIVTGSSARQEKPATKSAAKPKSTASSKPTPNKPAPKPRPTAAQDKKNHHSQPQQQKATGKSASVKTTSPSNPPSAKPSQTPLALGVIAVLIALSAIAGAGYVWDQQQKSSAAYQTRITELDEQLRAQQLSITSLGNVQTTVGQVITDLTSELGKLGSQIGQLGADVGQLGAQSGRVDQLEINLNQFTDRLETTLEEIAGRVNEISTSSRTDWQIAEVEYFLRLAVDSLIIEGNIKTAQSLLESADRLVQEIDDVGLIALRQAIADDLVAINGIRVPDYQGMAFTLNALAKQVDNLRLPLEPKQPQTVGEQANTTEPVEKTDPIDTSWQQQLKAKLVTLAARLKGLVTIRRTDQPVEPLMPPEQQIYLAQNLHLMLEQAQLALLRKNQALFQQSLDKSLGWIRTHYDPTDDASISFVTTLNELKDHDISLELPDISGSLRTFKQFQRQRLELDKQTAQAQHAKLEVNLR